MSIKITLIILLFTITAVVQESIFASIPVKQESVKTINSPPCPVGMPTNPNPADSAVDVDIYIGSLSWINPPEATNIEVWFDSVMIYSGAPVSTVTIPILEYNTTYQWQVNEANDTCMVNGPVWTFTTLHDPFDPVKFTDDFENGTGNWIITNNGGTCEWDLFNIDSRPYTMPPTATGFVLAADADFCGSGTSTITTIELANPLDFSFDNTIWIEFDNDWRTSSSADEAYIDVSNDGGAHWVIVASWLGIDNRATHEFVDLTDVTALQTDVSIRLRTIQPGWDWWWAVDNFTVYKAVCLSCPSPPSNLTATALHINNSIVQLNWQDNTIDEISFYIERSLVDSTNILHFNEIATVPPDTTSYIDTTVEDTTTYAYRVRTETQLSFTPYSNVAIVTSTIPVELTAFTGYLIDNNVQLKWATATETNNLGFRIERRSISELEKNGKWVNIGFVEGHGTTTEPQNYSFVDNSVTSGKYQYRLKQIDYNGTFEYYGPISVNSSKIGTYYLYQNYPNPFNPGTIIKFSTPRKAFITLTVYNSLGEKIKTLLNSYLPGGNHSIELKLEDLPATFSSGVYFYRLQADGYSETKKMLFLR